ncbi:LUD domain-containing protein [Vibrio sp. PP-XX7]
MPPCHVAVMHRASLCCHFLEVMETQHWAAGMPTNALLISGPSKTADIQQTLAYGAHGPAELIVLILEENT